VRRLTDDGGETMGNGDDERVGKLLLDGVLNL
jgi:hypothetical protein